jgi:membrane protease YdiL (CAAX protease family)
MDRDIVLGPAAGRTAARMFLAAGVADRAGILAPLLVLVVGGTIEVLRPVGVVVLLIGLVAVGRPLRPATLAWAAALPVGIELAWPIILGRDGALGALCADPLTEIVVRRIVQAGLILAVVVLLSRWLGQGPSTLGLTRPDSRAAGAAVAAGLIVSVGGLYLGPALATPLFGRVGFVAPVATIVPALAFAVANGMLEEITYRGVLMRWLGRLVGIWPALVVQGVVFGLAHAGPEILPAMLPVHITIMAACGIALGLVTLRTGSLTLAIGVHIGADVALYYGLACRSL